MHYFLSLTRLERINFFLFGFSIFCIFVSFVLSVQDRISLNTTRTININVAFDDISDVNGLSSSNKAQKYVRDLITSKKASINKSNYLRNNQHV